MQGLKAEFALRGDLSPANLSKSNEGCVRVAGVRRGIYGQTKQDINWIHCSQNHGFFREENHEN
jgi:hypothetical protein